MFNVLSGRRFRVCCALTTLVLVVLVVLRGTQGDAVDEIPLAAVDRGALSPIGSAEDDVPAVLRGVGFEGEHQFVKVKDEVDPSAIVHVKDLGDGEPVPDLPLAIQVHPPGNPRAMEREAVHINSSETGDVRIVERAIRVSVASGAWKVPEPYASHEILDSQELWVYREVGLTIRVVSELDPALGFDPTQVDLEWSVLSDGTTPITERPQGPWNYLWTRSHGLQPRHWSEAPDSEGLWTGRIPRVRGIEIRGTVAIPTVSPAVAALTIPPRDADSVEVVLTFRTGRRHIHGKVVSSTGAPLAHAIVRAYVATTVKTRDLSYDRLRSLGYAFTVVGNSEGESVLTLSTQAVTDEDGKYGFSLPQKGDLLLVVHAADHSPTRARFVRTEQEQEVGMEAVYVESPPGIHFLNKNKPMPGGHVVLTDLTSEPFQTNVEFALDDGSSAKVGWFEIGREYAIMARPSGPTNDCYFGFIKWDGRTEVDLSDLPNSLAEFRKK